MGYQPNVVSKSDIVEINGVLFECQNDFNKLKGDKKLKLKFIGDAPVDKALSLKMKVFSRERVKKNEKVGD